MTYFKEEDLLLLKTNTLVKIRLMFEPDDQILNYLKWNT